MMTITQLLITRTDVTVMVVMRHKSQQQQTELDSELLIFFSIYVHMRQIPFFHYSFRLVLLPVCQYVNIDVNKN